MTFVTGPGVWKFCGHVLRQAREASDCKLLDGSIENSPLWLLKTQNQRIEALGRVGPSLPVSED